MAARPAILYAALGALLLGLQGCGGTSPAGPNPGPTPLPTPAPTPLPNDITLVGTDPPPGSTISLATRSTVSLSLLLNVAPPGGLNLRLFLTEEPPTPGTACQAAAIRGPVGPGSGLSRTEVLDLSELATRCRLPHAMTLDLLLDDGDNTLALKEVRSIFTVTR